MSADPTLSTFVRLDRKWSDGDVVTVDLAMKIVAKRGVTVNSGWSSSPTATQMQADTAVEGQQQQGNGHGRNRRRAPHHQHQHQQPQLHAHMVGGGHMNTTSNLPFCTVERGPLLFALPLEPTGGADTFNYALDCDAASMVVSGSPGVRSRNSGGRFDWPLVGAPVTLAVKAAAIPWWDDIGMLPNASVSVGR